jgi:hypothetical protein
MSWNAKRYEGHEKSYWEKGVATSTHHRKPSSIGGSDETENKIELPNKEHRAWHNLFKNMPAWEIADKINRYFLDLDFEFVLAFRATKTLGISHNVPQNGNGNHVSGNGNSNGYHDKLPW